MSEIKADAEQAEPGPALELRRLGRWVPPISGVILLTTGSLTLLAWLP